MPTTPVQLRIYCICGQKMRVNPSMLGRPGKCIACRQKIRIPRADEIPARASEIFLKDHPEFLRNGNAGRTPDDFDGTVPSDDVALGNEGDDVESVAIDILPPLRELCSFEHKILQRLEVLRPASREGAEARERADLIRYRAMVRQAKAALEESLRQRLMDVAQQLGAAKEKLNRAAAAVRVGEMSYGEYQKSATALRHQRERLERRRQNLRGWLAVSDPHMAGGYL
ncbi:MAG: hypothetical protein IT368_04285, partial [Candidatus Hydrogenedentes bacterium]|nr:hypothetical protein [Candidatus Hydrogenedentota bacterium]